MTSTRGKKKIHSIVQSLFEKKKTPQCNIFNQNISIENNNFFYTEIVLTGKIEFVDHGQITQINISHQDFILETSI